MLQYPQMSKGVWWRNHGRICELKSYTSVALSFQDHLCQNRSSFMMVRSNALNRLILVYQFLQRLVLFWWFYSLYWYWSSALGLTRYNWLSYTTQYEWNTMSLLYAMLLSLLNHSLMYWRRELRCPVDGGVALTFFADFSSPLWCFSLTMSNRTVHKWAQVDVQISTIVIHVYFNVT